MKRSPFFSNYNAQNNYFVHSKSMNVITMFVILIVSKISYVNKCEKIVCESATVTSEVFYRYFVFLFSWSEVSKLWVNREWVARAPRSRTPSHRSATSRDGHALPRRPDRALHQSMRGQSGQERQAEKRPPRQISLEKGIRGWTHRCHAFHQKKGQCYKSCAVSLLVR